ncbi:hypothetical protein CCUS01_07116 [Colletotrichum cuscutae]|uniref:Uncharacterized protein n=1 Tax=Colletotrichum cuscutae TaxID=1209917 RepID=A0AAI9XYB2_9PEZI|nr:hypothetical protein CCUS01_07116 [Colletotrichum cuscutae]
MQRGLLPQMDGNKSKQMTKDGGIGQKSEEGSKGRRSLRRFAHAENQRSATGASSILGQFETIRNLIRLAWAALSVSAADLSQSELLHSCLRRRQDPEAAPTKFLSQGAEGSRPRTHGANDSAVSPGVQCMTRSGVQRKIRTCSMYLSPHTSCTDTSTLHQSRSPRFSHPSNFPPQPQPCAPFFVSVQDIHATPFPSSTVAPTKWKKSEVLPSGTLKSTGLTPIRLLPHSMPGARPPPRMDELSDTGKQGEAITTITTSHAGLLVLLPGPLMSPTYRGQWRQWMRFLDFRLDALAASQ